MERRGMGRVHFVGTEHPPRRNHPDRQFPFFHGPGLYRGRLGTQANLRIDKKGILFVPGRMIGGDVQFGKIVILVLHFRTFHHLVSHAYKNPLHLFERYHVGVAMAYVGFLGRKRNVDHFPFHLFFPGLSGQGGLGLLHLRLNQSPGVVHHLPYLWPFLWRNVFHVLQHAGQFTFFPQIRHPDVVQLFQGVGSLDFP